MTTLIKLITIFVFLNNLAFGQIKTEVISLLSIVKEETKSNYGVKMDKKQPIKLVFYGMFKFYKSFFSDQDLNSCSFHPSCSVYSIQSVKQNGIFKGLIQTFDRLSRCHSLAPEYYVLHNQTGKLFDPVR